MMHVSIEAAGDDFERLYVKHAAAVIRIASV
jgi:hypothetical protein